MNRSWLTKDYYRLLEVDEDADQAAVKKSYRRLAQKLHPDANPGDDKASERFKEVSEAYSVLSDPDRRKEYDQVRRPGAAGFAGGSRPGGTGFAGGSRPGAAGFAGGSRPGAAGFAAGGSRPSGTGNFAGGRVRFEDILGGMGANLGGLFGFGGGRSGPQRGADASAMLDLTFEQAVRGATTRVVVDSPAACGRCGGGGAEPGTPIDVCSGCGGTGTVASNQGVFSFTNPCRRCGGSGRMVEKPCTNCRGAGQERRVRNIGVRIPPGVKDGGVIRLRGKGAPGSRGGPPGDLLVELRVAAHPRFGRKGDDLLLTLPVSFTEAALGARVTVPTLNGPVCLKIPPGTPSGKTFRVRKEGVRRDRGRPGDLLVTVSVAVPPKLSKEAKKMLEEFRDKHETENPRGEYEQNGGA